MAGRGWPDSPLELQRHTGRVLVIGDLHHDFWAAEGRDPFAGVPRALFDGLDALIVAGDLTNKPKVRWAPALDWLAHHVDPARTCVFPGNHDYYDFRLDGDARLAEIAAAAGVAFVQDRAVHLGPTRFLCTTVWTDMALGGDLAANAVAAEARVTDFRKIRVGGSGYRKLRAADMVRRHRAHLAWLEAALASPHAGETVVVTHHAPLGAATRGDALAACFASDLGAVIDAHRPEHWLFGHTHLPFAARRGQTEVRNVSLGYPEEYSDAAATTRVGELVLTTGQAGDAVS